MNLENSGMAFKIIIYLRLNIQKMYCTYYQDKPDMQKLKENPKKILQHLYIYLGPIITI
jgi:hypothetical protein